VLTADLEPSTKSRARRFEIHEHTIERQCNADSFALDAMVPGYQAVLSMACARRAVRGRALSAAPVYRCSTPTAWHPTATWLVRGELPTAATACWRPADLPVTAARRACSYGHAAGPARGHLRGRQAHAVRLFEIHKRLKARAA